MRIHTLFSHTTFGVALLVGMGGGAHGAEITVLSSTAMKTVLEELAPQFQQATSHKLVLKFAPAAELKGRIEKGEAFDVAILVTAGIDDLIKQGKLDAATRANVAKSGAGVAIRQGAAKPDIATAESFKRTLLAAKSIAYVGTGATGANIRKIFDQLGIAEQMKAKTKLLSGIGAAEAIAKGEAELGFTQISEILHVAGAELAGPLPPELQVYTVFPAAVGTGARDAAAAQSFIRFLATPAAAKVIRAKGMEPG
jgi:molybdate transport system substrate-binding protein